MWAAAQTYAEGSLYERLAAVDENVELDVHSLKQLREFLKSTRRHSCSREGCRHGVKISFQAKICRELVPQSALLIISYYIVLRSKCVRHIFVGAKCMSMIRFKPPPPLDEAPACTSTGYCDRCDTECACAAPSLSRHRHPYGRYLYVDGAKYACPEGAHSHDPHGPIRRLKI